ncbi:MAG TPA: glycoside hydrolase family 30 protein [Polyangia bacterium]|nr:glycoside hydrolase family 30 protein [Polyangia bacterium]
MKPPCRLLGGLLVAALLGACSSGQSTTGAGGGSGTGTGGSTTGTGGSGTGTGGGGPGTGGSGTGTGGSAATTGTGGISPTGGSTGSGGSGTGTGGAAGSSSTGSGGSGPASMTLITSASGATWKTGALTTVTSGNADMTVVDGTVNQTIDGFGGAFNEMGWDDLKQLSSSDSAQAIDLLFGSDGARFVFGRIPIGATDFALTRYTDDETANDYTMDHFSIAPDQTNLIPYVQAALKVNPNLRLWASPWTPPTWMKTQDSSKSANGTSCKASGNTPFDGGCMVDSDQNLTAYALYLVKWVQAFGALGINIESVHPQNEPNYATGYPSCLWDVALFDKFIATYLGPTFAMQSNFNTKIYLGTMSNGNSGTDPAIVTKVTGDPAAMKYIAGFGMQWNMMSTVSSLISKNLPIMQTEHKCGNYPFSVSGENPAPGPMNPNMAPNDWTYGLETWGLIRDWLKSGVNSYSAWNMVLDTIGVSDISTGSKWPQNALLAVDRTAKTLIVTPAYYVFRHFSGFVDPGAKRVGTSGSSLDMLAFKNPDGSLVAVMFNSSSSAKTTTLQIGGAKLQFSVPGNGFASVKK